MVDFLRTLVGALRLLDRVLPGATELHDLGAMDPANPREGDHFWLLFAPPRHSGGPLAGEAECIHFLTSPDHTAVHQTRHKGRQFRPSDCDHDLIQQRHAPSELSQSD